MIYFFKRLIRTKWFERVVVSFLSWKNRYAVWLIKSKRTNHVIVFRKGSNVLKSSSVGPEVELKKQRRVPYFLKSLSKKVWSIYMNRDWTQLHIHLNGGLKNLELGTDSIIKSYGYGRRRLRYSMYGFRWWYKRAMRKLRRRVPFYMRKNMNRYYRRALVVLYSKPYVILNKNKKQVDLCLRSKWLESRLRGRRENKELFMRLQRKWLLKLRDKKRKTWYFYHTEIQSALRSGVMIHSLSDYTSHPFGGKRYRKRNLIR